MISRNIPPFKFSTRLHLTELTGLRASNLSQLLNGIKNMPASSIYHHTHRFLQDYQYFIPESTNDFAYWVSEVLGDVELGEQLASIDTMRYPKIHDLHEKIVQTIEDYLKNNVFANLRFARGNEEFHFIKTVSFVLPTNFVAYNLTDFVEILKKVTIDSIYFHVFEARLRLERPTNDFSIWIEESLGDKELAGMISKLDPYTRTLEDLRKTIIKIIEPKIYIEHDVSTRGHVQKDTM